MAAVVDGCSEFQVFRHVMARLTSGGILATGVFIFAAWKELLFAVGCRVPKDASGTARFTRRVTLIRSS